MRTSQSIVASFSSPFGGGTRWLRRGLAAAACLCAAPAWAQQVVVQGSGLELTEPYTFVYTNPLGVTETIVSTNNGSTILPNLWYGCTNNGYGSWRTPLEIVSPTEGGDTSGFGASNAVIVSVRSDSNGINWYWTSEPCPASGNPSWSTGGWVTDSAHTVDYPNSTYDTNYGQMGVTFSQQVSGHRRMFVGRISSNFSSMSYFWNSCSNIANDNINLITSVFDDNGDQQIVYADYTTGYIQYEVYRRTTGFACINKRVGSFSFPSPACSSCPGLPTFNGMSNQCLEANPSPTITFQSGTQNLVISYSTPGSGSCSSQNETRIYNSTNMGSTWSFALVTGCHNSIYTRAAAAPYASTPDLHVLSSYSNDNSTFQQVDWRSSNGVSWGGYYASNPWVPVSFSNCYWGDYNGAAYDSTYNVMFNAWTVPRSWVIDGTDFVP
jgi:hypothetical protein